MKKRSILLLVFLIVTLAFSFNPVNASPTYEDFTTFTEVDPATHIEVVSSTRVNFESDRDIDAYLYKDLYYRLLPLYCFNN